MHIDGNTNFGSSTLVSPGEFPAQPPLLVLHCSRLSKYPSLEAGLTIGPWASRLPVSEALSPRNAPKTFSKALLRIPRPEDYTAG